MNWLLETTQHPFIDIRLIAKTNEFNNCTEIVLSSVMHCVRIQELHRHDIYRQMSQLIQINRSIRS